MNKTIKINDKIKPIFLHSSFRTGSTWLWSKFRENLDCYCYYEVFNEILGTLNFRNISKSASDWNSHHPSGAPYFSEFSPLLDKEKGIIGFDQDMSLADFFLDSDDDLNRVSRTEAYLTSLVDLGRHNGRVPVLSCTRSIGRVRLIKRKIGGTHILIKRRLLNQWFSYSNQASHHNPFFFKTVIDLVKANHADDFISMVRSMLDENDISQVNFGTDHDVILIAFIAIHIYMYVKYSDNFDIIIDFQKGSSKKDIQKVAQTIKNFTTVDVDLSDYRETISAPSKLIRDLDRVFIMVRSLFAKGIPGVEDEKLRHIVDEELADFRQGYEQYLRIAGSAHLQIEAFAVNQSYLEAARKAAVDDLAALSQSAGQQIADLNDRIASITNELAELAQRLHETGAALEQEREHSRALQGQVEQANLQLRELEAELERNRADRTIVERQHAESEHARTLAESALLAAQERCSTLDQDLQKAEGREEDLRIRLEVAGGECDMLTQRLHETGAALEQEREQKELALAELDYVSSGRAQEAEELGRKWDAMIKRLR